MGAAMDFEERISQAIRDSIEHGYRPSGFVRMRKKYPTVEAIKKLLHRPDDPRGFTRLLKMNRLDLSLEAIILEKEWRSLFTFEELEIAKRRLDKFGYKPRVDHTAEKA